MFKVICIQKPTHKWCGSGSAPGLEVGNTYTVIEEETYRGYKFYVLAECGYKNSYDARCFGLIDGGPCEKEILESRVDQEIARLDEDWRQIVREHETV